MQRFTASNGHEPVPLDGPRAGLRLSLLYLLHAMFVVLLDARSVINFRGNRRGTQLDARGASR
jgi:hypothetical protein